jgi:hypothetical protein
MSNDEPQLSEEYLAAWDEFARLVRVHAPWEETREAFKKVNSVLDREKAERG